MARCDSCDAVIEWVQLNGKPHPIDAGANPAGNLIEMTQAERAAALAGARADAPRRGGRMLRAISKKAPAPEGALRYMSHFATCPNAAKHRKGR